MKILVINAGSSSLKYQLIEMETEQVIAKGVCERVTMEKSRLVHKVGDREYKIEHPMPTHTEALSLVLSTLTDVEKGVIKSLDEIAAVGHRVLHGAEDFKESVLIDDEVVRICEKNKELGPLHMPANIACICACRKLLPVPQVAAFDTSFHQTMPDYAYRYALPEKYYTEWRMRRFGFHGTSHKYVSGEAIKYLGKKESKIITCHLGNGSSLAAVLNGKCVDTSMGYTPLAGVPMGTRSGDIDPALLEAICNKTGMNISDAINLGLNKLSGMQGIAGKSDFRDLASMAAEGDANAQLGLNMFAYGVKKFIGSYVAAMNGVDAVVMTGGIGENSVDVRAMILKDMEYLGITFDPEKNNVRGKFADITAPGGKVKVLVIPTNEELVIARDTKALAFPSAK
ncbi:MAG: acetate kinase [Clostridia bacterium]|nr:acetate kinase [Clostridia bacterium]